MPRNNWGDREAIRSDRREARSGDDVADELMFHFRQIVDEKLAEGRSFDDAWILAEQRFGPMRRYDYECRFGQDSRRFHWHMSALLAAVAITAVIGWSMYHSNRRDTQGEVEVLRREVVLLRQEHQALTADPFRNGPVQRIAGGFDFNGEVLDDTGYPLGQVTLLIIRKTWPGGGYRQEAFSATTNDAGRFSLSEFVPADDQYAIQVAAFKEGFAFQSAYQLHDKQPIDRPDSFVLRLPRAAPVTLTVRDAAGNPVANAGIIPSARTPSAGRDQRIYFQGSEQIEKRTDAEGRVRLHCFGSGDQATVYVRFPDDDWQRRQFEVTGDGPDIDLSAIDDEINSG
jgi:hypothetical protein